MVDDKERGPRFAADAGLAGRPEGVQLRARRSPRLIALGVLCACLGGLLAAFLYTSSVRSESVLVLTRLVSRGETLASGDLSVVTVGSLPGVTTVPAGRMGDMVGKTALVDLPKGSPLGPQSVGEAIVAPDTAQVGLRLAAGRVPMQPMPAGAHVALIEVADGKSELGRTFEATLIAAPTELGDGITLLVDVRVADADAGRIAALASQDRLALVRRADR